MRKLPILIGPSKLFRGRIQPEILPEFSFIRLFENHFWRFLPIYSSDFRASVVSSLPRMACYHLHNQYQHNAWSSISGRCHGHKSGLRIDPCLTTDIIFSHELQKQFIFPFCFSSVVLYCLVTCSRATFPCLTVTRKAIAGTGFRNLCKSLKREDGFFKSNSCKSGK